MSPAADLRAVAVAAESATAGPVDIATAVGLPVGLAAAIERAVEQQGGDSDDVRDLALVWRKVLDDSERRAAAIRSTVARRRCPCADGGTESHAAEDAARCGRCHGRLDVEGART